MLIGLALASLWSWAVIIDKLVRFAALNRQADRFEDEVGSGRALEDIAAEAGERPAPRPAADAAGGAARMARGARQGPAAGARPRPRPRSWCSASTGCWTRIIARESAAGRGRAGHAWPSSPPPRRSSACSARSGASCTPSRPSRSQKNTNLAVVAPAIAEALFATAIGLAAAIPAYIAYNKFSTDAGKFAGRLEGFADDLVTAIQRRLAERSA